MLKRSGILLTTILLLLAGSVTAHAEAVVTAGNHYDTLQILPLYEIETHIEVEGQVATTIIDQTFFNTTNQTNAQYHYPLPERASITGFGVWINDEVHYFDLAATEGGSGHGGSSSMPQELRDFLGDNPFVAPLSQLPTDDHFTLRFEYTELMHYNFGVYDLMYPLATAPWTEGVVQEMSTWINVSSPREIEQVQIGNYQGDILHQTADSVSIHIIDRFFHPTDNITFSMSVNQQEVGMWLMPHTNLQDETRHFLAVLEPGDLSEGSVIQKSFTFVLDRSGSMSGQDRISEAKEAAIYCIQNLGEGDVFNLITFSASVESWRSEPVLATPENILNATAFINGLSAAGMTRLNDAMITALTQTIPDNVANQILLLSDGLPTSGETNLRNILANIQANNENNASIFTVGVGDEGDSDLDFLRLIAYENHGNSIYLAPGTVDISEEIATFFNQFASPVITDIEVDFGPINASEIYPPGPYNIFIGSQTVIAGMYTTPANTEISITGTVADHDTTISYGPFDFPDIGTDYEFVPRMWAIRKIDYWLAWMSVNGEDEETIDMIIELSLRYGILTPYTSYETDFPTAMGETLRVTARTAVEGIYLSWNPIAGNAGATYDIYRRELNSRAWLKLNDTPVTSSTYLDRNAAPGVGYVYRIVMHGDDMKSVVEEITVQGVKSAAFELESVHPNPFNERTEVRFQLATASRVRIEVYDILGRQVATLLDGQASVGRHAVSLDASTMSSGLYFLRMQATTLDGSATSSKIARITLVK